MNIDPSDNTFLTITSLLTIAAIAATAFLYFVRHDYNFILEAPCDQTSEQCFTRDCSDGECPDNGLEQYRIFSVRADDFATCRDNSCLEECLSHAITCDEVVCGGSPEDICAAVPTEPISLQE